MSERQDCLLIVAREETLRVFEAWLGDLADGELRTLQINGIAH